jgi:repressor of nif and glnA expression
LLKAGEKLGDTVIPNGYVGLCTVCSITINGILLARGVPTRSRFGGLLAIENGEPDHFVELIEYDGTSIDPLEVFIRSGMTDYLGTIHTGSGRVGASFREYPASSRDLVLETAASLREKDLGGIVKVGYPGCSLLGVQVSEGRFGAILMGGLNPIAILEERDIRIDSRALHGLMTFEQLIPYGELRGELKRLA